MCCNIQHRVYHTLTAQHSTAEHGAWLSTDRSPRQHVIAGHRRSGIASYLLSPLHAEYTCQMTEVRGQRLFLIPIGKENPHQHTIDGKLPTGVPLHTTASKLLPCWGVTDGNYLVKNHLRAEAGDVFAFIRAKSAGQAAYVHRLAVLDSFVRDEAAASDLYQLKHNYSMGKHAKEYAGYLAKMMQRLAHNLTNLL